ncbi:hypothetical protein MMC08_007871 [Hypocenomyce scalaris]|nr:hypothetical protein [Hypocenomyce scalaris]
MALPENCEVLARKEIAESKPPVFKFRSPRDTLIEGGFIIIGEEFRDVIGPKPELECILRNDKYPFAHEAGVYIESTGEVFITSNQFKVNGEKKIQLSKFQKQAGGWECIEIETDVLMGNGGVNYKDGILFCAQGTFTDPGGLIFMEPTPPYKTRTILSNYHGRWFNSVNDVVIHTDGSIWFTDPTYGFEQNIRPHPQLPRQVYRYDPKTGDIRAVADGICRPNGLCFSPDEKTMYITDTDGVHGIGGYGGVYELNRPASIYAFDIIERHGAQFLANKRLFAFADDGIPDGIKCDLDGNVYSGCGDGVHVWSPGGSLIGKIYFPGGCANFCFGKDGEVFCLNESKVWRAKFDSKTKGALLRI